MLSPNADERTRAMTEDSFQSHAYRILHDGDEENLMDLEPMENHPLEDSIFVHDKFMAAVEDDDDEDLTPFLFSSEPAQLNGLNFLNMVTNMAHLFVSWGVGVWGLDGILSTRVEIILEYETLVTPAKWAYYIWIPILLSETIFMVAQMLPEYRARPIVQDGTGFFFFYTCLLQTAWTMFFSFKLFILSFVAVVFATVSLASLLASQALCLSRGPRSKVEYWLFRFPFYLHFGWIVVMAVVQLALLVRCDSSNISAHLATDLIALAVLLPVACYNLLQTETNNFVVPIVILWSYIGIAWRLNDPDTTLVSSYSEDVVQAFNASCYVLAGIICCMLLPRISLWACQEFCTIQVVQLEDTFTQFHETLNPSQ